jgi:hypothetical protein
MTTPADFKEMPLPARARALVAVGLVDGQWVEDARAVLREIADAAPAHGDGELCDLDHGDGRVICIVCACGAHVPSHQWGPHLAAARAIEPPPGGAPAARAEVGP